MSAHEGIKSLALLETSAITPRETLKGMWDKGHRVLPNVTFFVKGYLPDHDNKYVTVENICWSCLLSWHCNIIIEDNPDIVNYIGKLITCNIEIYPYPDNPDKFAFNILGEPEYVESDEYYSMVSNTMNVPEFYVEDVNKFINGIIGFDINRKLKYVNEVVANLEGFSTVLYNNESVIINLVLNTLFMSTDIDRKVLSDGLFINNYFYDIMMILVKLLDSLVEKQIKYYTDLMDEVLYIIGIYTNSPMLNNYRFTEEFVASCMLFKVSTKQANFYYKHLIKHMYDPMTVIEDVRISMIEDMKQLVINWCMSSY